MNWENLKAGVAAVVKTNNNQEITGQNLQGVLNSIIDSVGANATFAGIAVPATAPGTPDGPVFYIAEEHGQYSNFGNINFSEGHIGVFLWNNSSWQLNTFNINLPDYATKEEFDELDAELNVQQATSAAYIDKTKIFTSAVRINTSDLWENGYTNYVVAVSPNDTINVSRNATGSVQYAFLKSYPTPVAGQRPDFSDVTSGRQNMASGTSEFSLTAPSDTYYVWFLATNIYNIGINGEMFGSLFPRISDIESSVHGRTFAHHNGHALSSGVIDQASANHYILVDVRDYRGLSLTATWTSSAHQWGFVAKVNESNTAIRSLEWCGGTTRVTGSPTNATIPSDCNFVYFVLSETYTFPTFTIDGVAVDFSKSLPSRILAVEKKSADINGLQTILNGQTVNGIKQITINAMSEMLDYSSKNLYNPANAAPTLRVQLATLKIITDSGLYGSTGFIEVEEGEWYTFSANQVSVYQGAYFAADANLSAGQSALQAITFTNPVSGVGKCFQVPTGIGAKYVLITLNANSDHTAITSTNVQLEKGEMATDYKPYDPQPKIKESLLQGGGGGGVITTDTLAQYTTFGNLKYAGIADKIPNFRKHWILKDKDLVVVNTGTSLTARSSEHCTILADAAYRPPLMHSNNFATHIWNALKWEGQQYRRYDAKAEQGGNADMFTETGTFQTQSNIADWDDGAYRAGFTRYTEDANAAVAFVIPDDAYQFNFIYRTDQHGSTACVVAVMQGNGYLQAWNGSAWVEANGYSFSMLESAVTTLSSISYRSPNSAPGSTPLSLGNVQTKGNTTYQKRLKMRTVSRGNALNVSISSASGRFMYWGVEWSPRQYMITYINAARGSHNSLITNNVGSHNLIHYQDNEVWSFEPDLLLTEDPIHNSGGGGLPSTSYKSYYFANVTENFFFDTTNSVSMTARCTTLLGASKVPEMVIFNSTLTYNFGAFDTDSGELFVSKLADGACWTALDAQMSCYLAVLTNHPTAVYINAVKGWVEAAVACYGNLASATEGSGKNGLTFTNEGSHWNDTGSKVMARLILPVLDLTI